LHSWRFASNRLKTSDEYIILIRDFFASAKLQPALIDSAILASVVPPLVPVFEEVCQELFGKRASVVGPGMSLGLKIKTRNPDEVGADRLVNAVAGFSRYGGPLLVVDFGTATTVDAVSRRGEYLGGAILPGLVISIEALVARTAKLPRIEMAKPKKPIGDSTLEAMRSGIYFGTIGQVRELIRALGKALGGRPKVIATGGLSAWIPAREVGIHKVEPDLTLEGLRLIHERQLGARVARRPRARRG
jgi:type III pantothenate kinase